MGISWSKQRRQPFIHDLIDVESLRRIRDRIELSTGLPLQVRDASGQLWPDLSKSLQCCELVTSTPTGKAFCQRKARTSCPEGAGGTQDYICLVGAHHLVTPIVLGGNRVAMLVLGPFFYHPPSRCNFSVSVRQLAVDEDSLFQAFSSAPMASGKQAHELAHQLGLAGLLVSEQMETARHNFELREQSEQRARQLTALADIGSLVLNADDADGTLRELVNRICKVTGANYSSICLVDPRDKRITKAVRSGPLPKRARPLAIELASNTAMSEVLQDVLKNRSVVIIDDPANNPTLFEYTRLLCQLRGLRTLLAAPIVLNNETTGLLVLGYKRSQAFAQRDMPFVGALCSQVAIAAKNATTYAEQVEGKRRAMLTAEISQMLSSTIHPQEVLQRITERATDVLGDLCIIGIVQGKASDVVDCAVFHHCDERKGKKMARAIHASQLRVGEGFAGRVIETGEPVFVYGTVEDDFQFALRPSLPDLGIHSVMGAPIKAKGRTVGAFVTMESRPGKVFTKSDLSFLSALAERVSVAVEHARLYSIAETESHKLGAVISGMADGVMIFDGDGRVVSLNRAGTDILAPIQLGASFADLHAVLKPRYTNGQDIPLDQLPVARVLLGGLPSASAEMVIQLADGETKTIQFSTAPVGNGAGRGYGAVSVFRDVTTQKQMDRLKDEFISVLSHELRAPLATISGYTQLLIKQIRGRDDLREELSELELIRTCTHQLATLVRNLLDVSRHETGSLALNLQPISLVEAVNPVALRLAKLSHNHRLVVHVPSDLPQILADRDRVQQVLSNLIGNAIKFSPDGGEIVVSAQISEGQALVSIRDHGIGIGKYDLCRLFDRFYRADNAENRTFEGIGLGLHVSRILVEAHGGQITARSKKGHGSVFSFTLPIPVYGGECADSNDC